jgi:hypothetical protein
MIIRIIRDGSSERSRSSVMFAAKMSRVREKILIYALRILFQGPVRIFLFKTHASISKSSKRRESTGFSLCGKHK